MPPPTHLRALARAPPSASPSAARAFSSTPATCRQRIPPESPKYINVPLPPLSAAVEDQHRSWLSYKGHLPVPRDVFKQKANAPLPKASEAFIRKSAPLPSSEKALAAPGSEQEAWRRRMADVRRRNMEEGITALWDRSRKFERQRKARSKARAEFNRTAMNAPKRESDRLTEISVPAALLNTRVMPDPGRFETARESAARTAAIAAEKSQNRKDALQQLYMNARKFIVTEDELEKAIEEQFRPDYFSSRNSAAYSSNIWDADGKPMTVTQMVGEALGHSNKVLQTADHTRTTKRHQKVSEELTGGAMDNN